MVTGRRFDQPEAMLDGSEHQITNVLTADPLMVARILMASRSQPSSAEGDPHPLTIFAADFWGDAGLCRAARKARTKAKAPNTKPAAPLPLGYASPWAAGRAGKRGTSAAV